MGKRGKKGGIYLNSNRKPQTGVGKQAVNFNATYWNCTMSLNASIKKGKEGQESDLRLASMIGGSNRQKKENLLKKKRMNNSYLDAYNKANQSDITKEDVRLRNNDDQ